MNRTERRNKEKADKKNSNKTIEAMKWINSLSPERMELIKSVLNNETEKEQKHIIGAIERCYTAGIIDILEDDISINQIEKIMERCSDLLVEDAKKVAEQKQKCGGNYEMAIKKVNAIANEVGNRIKDLISQGVDTKELKVKISLEYPTLSKAMITNSIKRVKEELKVTEKVKEVISEEEAEKQLLDIFGVDREETSEVIPAAKEIVEEVEDEFKILKIRSLDFEGKHGTYNVENKVITVDGNLAFCLESEVREWCSDEVAKLNLIIENIKAKQNEIIRAMDKYLK